MKFLPINTDNVCYLEDFIESMGDSSPSFRYYSSRNPNEVIKNHISTFLLIDDGCVGYGHLDKEDEKVWLGICVKEGRKGKGYGKAIMEKLVSSYDGDIYLSVDIDNHVAINLYKTFYFEKIDTSDKLYFMRKNATNL
mgnify:FL=1